MCQWNLNVVILFRMFDDLQMVTETTEMSLNYGIR